MWCIPPAVDCKPITGIGLPRNSVAWFAHVKRGTWNGQRSWPRRRVGWPCQACGYRGAAESYLLPGWVHQGSRPYGGERMIRGGSWNNNPDNLRTSNRNRNTTDNRNNNLGFRLVQSTCTASGRSGAGLCRDSSGETAGVHGPASRPPFQQGTPNRGSGVRRLGAARSRAYGPGRHLVLRGRVRKNGEVSIINQCLNARMSSPAAFSQARKRRSSGMSTKDPSDRPPPPEFSHVVIPAGCLSEFHFP